MSCPFFFRFETEFIFSFCPFNLSYLPTRKKKKNLADLPSASDCVISNPAQYYIEKQKEVVFILGIPDPAVCSSSTYQKLERHSLLLRSNDGNPLDFKLPRFFQKQSSSNNFAPTDWTYGTAAHRRYRRSKRGNHSRHGCPTP